MLQIDTTGMQRTQKPAVAMAIKQLLREFPVHPGTAMHVGKSLFCRAARHLHVIDGSASWLIHCALNKMTDNVQTTFSIAFCWKKMFIILIQISLKFVSKVPIDNKSSAFDSGEDWCRARDKSLPEPMLTKTPDVLWELLPLNCRIDGLTTQIVSNATLAQKWLMATSHYLKRYPSHLPQKIVWKLLIKISFKSPRANEFIKQQSGRWNKMLRNSSPHKRLQMYSFNIFCIACMNKQLTKYNNDRWN